MAMKQKTTKIAPTKVTTPLRDQCLSHCATLGIPLEPAALDELLSRAEKDGLPHLQFLDLLLGSQANARRERGVARRIREAHFAEEKTLEAFDWLFNPEAFDRVRIEELATGDFIRRRSNLILVGWSGIGKSHIIQALGHTLVHLTEYWVHLTSRPARPDAHHGSGLMHRNLGRGGRSG